MHIDKARKLKIGQKVTCPPDRGDKGYVGTVTHISHETHRNIHDHEYLWVEVHGPQHKSVWPSNRLS